MTLIHSPFFQLSFNQSLLLVQATMVIGMVIASLTPHDYFSKRSLTEITIWISSCFFLLALSNIGAFTGYLSAKVNPKISSMVLSKLPSEVLAQTSNFLSLLFSVSIPLGSILFTTLTLWNVTATWLMFSLMACLALGFLSNDKTRK